MALALVLFYPLLGQVVVYTSLRGHKLVAAENRAYPVRVPAVQSSSSGR